MRLFVSGATTTLRRYPNSPYLGALLVPHAGNRIDSLLAPGFPWAADNAAFTGFDAPAFCRLLGRIAGRPGCRFVACPDVVGDACATRELFEVWEPILRSLSLPVALVAQDGLRPADVPWKRVDALFVGGSTEWKVGPGAAALIQAAKSEGKWVHLGRCNTRKRFRYAYQLGCDSVDGSGFSQWPDQRVPLAVRWLEEFHGTSLHRDRYRGTFFRGGMSHGLLASKGLVIEQVEETVDAYRVLARYRAEPMACPQCRQSAPDQVRLRQHGTRGICVVDVPRHGKPVRVWVECSRFQCSACDATFTSRPSGVDERFRISAPLVDRLIDAGTSAEGFAKVAGLGVATVRRVRRLRSGVVDPATTPR